jgi:hypothetical protein
MSRYPEPENARRRRAMTCSSPTGVVARFGRSRCRYAAIVAPPSRSRMARQLIPECAPSAAHLGAAIAVSRSKTTFPQKSCKPRPTVTSLTSGGGFAESLQTTIYRNRTYLPGRARPASINEVMLGLSLRHAAASPIRASVRVRGHSLPLGIPRCDLLVSDRRMPVDRSGRS